MYRHKYYPATVVYSMRVNYSAGHSFYNINIDVYSADMSAPLSDLAYHLTLYDNHHIIIYKFPFFLLKVGIFWSEYI